MEDPIELASGFFIATERLFDHDPRIVGAPGLGQVFDDGAEQTGRDRQVVQRPGRAVERLAQLLERLEIVVIAVDVAQPLEKLGERRLVDPAVLLEAVASPRLKLLERPAALATPMTGTSRCPCWIKVWSAGKTFL